MKKKQVKWFRHEALHTTNLVSEIINAQIVDHHYYHSNINTEFVNQIDLALEALNKAYQLIVKGQENLNETKY